MKPILLTRVANVSLVATTGVQVSVGPRVDRDRDVGANVTLSLTYTTTTALNNWILQRQDF